MQKLNRDTIFSKYMLGIAFLFVAVVIYTILFAVGKQAFEIKSNTNAYTNASKIEVLTNNSDGSVQYSPIFYFNVDGKEYTCKTSFSRGSRPSVTKNKLYYNSSNPNICISEYELSQLPVIFIFIILFSFVDIAAGLYFLINANSENKRIKQLAQSGLLVKNLPCEIENNLKGYKIKIDYKIADGNILKLKSEIRRDYNYIGRQTADLLIDPLNTKNYFIDFDIEI